MRRKSERTATKKAKASPEKKVEKVKHTRSRRKKHSTSSENESADDASPVREAEPAPVPEVNPPKTPVKEDSPEEAQDQVWRVKTAESSGDTGEIQKLKICLTRPPTTPERVDRSPRSKRKHSRATSSSDTPSVEGPEDKRKTKHRKRSHRESKDESEKTQDSQEEEAESDSKSNQELGKSSEEATQSDAEGKVDSSENTISTSNQENKSEEKANVDSTEDSSKKDEGQSEALKKEDKASDADTTVVSPEAETTVVSATSEVKTSSTSETQEHQAEDKTAEPDSPTRKRSASVDIDKSEILELHPEDSKVELDIEADKSKSKGKSSEKTKEDKKVSKYRSTTPTRESRSDNDRSSNKTGVVASSKNEKRSRNMSTDSGKERDAVSKEQSSNEDNNRKSFDRSDSIQSNQEEAHHNGQATPFVVSRKRRWGSRPSKVTKQKSLTISTDILKDIIPDVKPVEFEEVIEEKKHKRVVTEKIERPVLPKIIIDNSENVNRENDHGTNRNEDEKDVVKVAKDLSSNRKISIIKDNDSIITRPPSPPRHRQSRVLYITNLVRPFTLPQLKNLLQRTGRLVENGFWIDRIKSKCFVIYETEDQAVETRHALHGVTWPVSNPKTLQVDFSTQEAFDKAKTNEDTDNALVSTIPGTVEDWLREQDMKRERGEMEKPWERKLVTREWDLGKNDKDKEKERPRREDRTPLDKRRHRTPERSPEPARKFKKKEEEAPAKLLDDLFKKTKATPCIYWLPLSAETIAIKEEQRRQHMAEHERRMQEQRRPHRRH